MKIFKSIICLFKGHDIDPDESIVGNIMMDERNWICKCHRCGLYEMHDGAISNSSITLTESQALRTKRDLELEFKHILWIGELREKQKHETD